MTLALLLLLIIIITVTITFGALLSEQRRYCGARRLCVCECVCPPSRDCTLITLVSAVKVMHW